MSKFYVLKTEGKLLEFTEHDKNELKPSHFKFLKSKGIITEDKALFDKMIAERKNVSDKYEKIANKKFKYEIKFPNNSDNVKINFNEILLNLKSINGDAYINSTVTELLITKEDIKNSVYKTIELIGADNFKFNVQIRFDEIPLKCKAKRMGLKSILVNENELILTSFSKNDDVIKEKLIIDNNINKVTSYINPENYSVNDVNNHYLELKQGNLKVKIDNPSHSSTSNSISVKQDYLKRKDVIEKMFFGRTFNDNIHIQLAYNILDIKKLLGLYINEVIFTMENLQRTGKTDLVGIIRYDKEEYRKEYDDYFKNVYKYLKYFSGAYSKNAFDKVKLLNANGQEYYAVDEDKIKKETYKILRILSMLRQFCFHSTTDLYNLEKVENISDLSNIINDRFNEVYDNLIKSTVDTSKKNIAIIFKALNLDDNKENKKFILNDYFKFIINKSMNNIGFNFKRLKEELLKKLNLEVTEDKQSTYTVINYIIYHELSKREDIIDKYIKKLLESEKELDKDSIYDSFASEIKPLFKDIITNELINNDKSDKYDDFKIDKSYLNFEFNNNSLFHKVIYFLTIFLDKKEINMLITGLINKLNNINGFVKLLDNNSSLLDSYKIFDNGNAKVLSDNLSIVLNIARMQKNFNKKLKNDKNDKANTPSQEMIYDAYCLFGYDISLDDFNKESEKDREQANKKVAKFQNKINSVIVNSNKFRYIVNYANPKDCYKIMRNKKVIEFVLKELPQTQIDRYLIKRSYSTSDDKIKYLASELATLNINMMRNSYNMDLNENSMELPKLYMTVIYQVIKQMVRINSYYNIAFSCYERDRCLFGISEEYKEYSDLILLESFRSGTTSFDISKNKNQETIIIDSPKNKYNRKVDGKIIQAEGPKLGSSKYNYLDNDINVFKSVFYTPTLINEKDIKARIEKNTSQIENCNIIYRNTYRNKIAHLNVIARLGEVLDEFNNDDNKKMNSYFELYQYAIQKEFISEYKNIANNEYINQYAEDIDKYKTYSKDLLHILNLPFAYNMARYKNITIEDIFYDRFNNKLKMDNK